MRLRTPAAILATAVLAVGLSTVTTASAAQTSAGAKIYACVLKPSGLTRIVSATTKCKPTEYKTWWDKSSAQATTALNTQGPQGPTGARGLQGERGLTGPQGPAGVAGVKGATGPAGEKGATGVAGPAGTKGADGADGQDGADGKGLNGPFVLDLNGLQSLCQWDGSVKGYPRLKCSLKFGNAPSPTPTPSFTPTPTGKPEPTPSFTPTSK